MANKPKYVQEHFMGSRKPQDWNIAIGERQPLAEAKNSFARDNVRVQNLSGGDRKPENLNIAIGVRQP